MVDDLGSALDDVSEDRRFSGRVNRRLWVPQEAGLFAENGPTVLLLLLALGTGLLIAVSGIALYLSQLLSPLG